MIIDLICKKKQEYNDPKIDDYNQARCVFVFVFFIDAWILSMQKCQSFQNTHKEKTHTYTKHTLLWVLNAK